MGMAISGSQPPDLVETEDLYEFVDGKKVWPTVTPPETDAIYEFVNGQQVAIPHMGVFAGTLAGVLVTHLNMVVFQCKLGLAVVEVTFRLRGQPRLDRRPDVAFIRFDRLPSPIFPPDDPAVWEAVPNLAVEIVSPTNNALEIVDKLHDYFQMGVELVWVMYPKYREVYVYHSPVQTRILQEQGELDGEQVLPGFRLKVADLFAPLVKP